MSDVARMERDLEENRERVRRRALALKLGSIPEFKELILEGFCLRDCAMYAQLSGDPAIPAENRADALLNAQAAGALRRYLSVIIQMGYQAEKDIRDTEDELVIARAEESQS